MLSRSFILLVLQVLALVTSVFALTTTSSSRAPLVILEYGAFRGFNSAGSTESFLGIPFAQPPVGHLRFNNPVAPRSFSGVRSATWFGPACPQQPFLGPNQSFPDNPELGAAYPYIKMLQPHTLVNDSEDCLYLNVVRPAGVRAGANLPVVVWIYGGGFENGDASGYNGTHVVSRSIGLHSPVIFVSFNYRVNAFGFLGGKEVKAAGLGNFGLYDQRFALQWIQKYISQFGGNPQQVILWGQSAGSISALLQMVAYDGQVNGLFHGAVMESGAATPMHAITAQHVQGHYDFLVEQADCISASDTLNCLRQAPYEKIMSAVLQTPSLLSYQALNTSWRPMVDGVFLKQTIRQSLTQGRYAQVPAILGDVDDEGTLFSLSSFNVTTDDQFLEYIHSNFLEGATKLDLYLIGTLYPADPRFGSPFDVGTNSNLTAQYKRISAFQGDFYFHLPRRFAASYLSQTQNTWSFLFKRDKFLPAIGSFHESDLQEFFNLTGNPDWVGADALVNFAYHLDPNVPAGGYPSGAAPSLLSNISWPKYQISSPQLLTFEDPNILTFTVDNYRAAVIAFLNLIQEQLGF